MGNLILKGKEAGSLPRIELTADKGEDNTLVYRQAYSGQLIEVENTPVQVLTTLDITIETKTDENGNVISQVPITLNDVVSRKGDTMNGDLSFNCDAASENKSNSYSVIFQSSNGEKSTKINATPQNLNIEVQTADKTKNFSLPIDEEGENTNSDYEILATNPEGKYTIFNENQMGHSIPKGKNIILTTNQGVGNRFTPIYIDVDGRIRPCDLQFSSDLTDWETIRNNVRNGYEYPLGYEFKIKNEPNSATSIWRVIGHNHPVYYPSSDLKIGDFVRLNNETRLYESENGTYSKIPHPLVHAIEYKVTRINFGTVFIEPANQSEAKLLSYIPDDKDIIFQYGVNSSYILKRFDTSITLETKYPIIGSRANCGYGLEYIVLSDYKDMKVNDYLCFAIDSFKVNTQTEPSMTWLCLKLNENLKEKDTKHYIVKPNYKDGYLNNAWQQEQHFIEGDVYSSAIYNIEKPNLVYKIYPYEMPPSAEDGPGIELQEAKICTFKLLDPTQAGAAMWEEFLTDLLYDSEKNNSIYCISSNPHQTHRWFYGGNTYADSSLRSFLNNAIYTDNSNNYSPESDSWGHLSGEMQNYLPSNFIREVGYTSIVYAGNEAYEPSIINTRAYPQAVLDKFFVLSEYELHGKSSNDPTRERIFYEYYEQHPTEICGYDLMGNYLPTRMTRTPTVGTSYKMQVIQDDTESDSQPASSVQSVYVACTIG